MRIIGEHHMAVRHGGTFNISCAPNCLMVLFEDQFLHRLMDFTLGCYWTTMGPLRLKNNRSVG
jgi:hypothetical protein